MSSFLIIYFCMLVSQISCKPFDDYTLYKVTAFNHRERALLYFLHVRNPMIIFLNGITNEAAVPMDVIVDGCCTNFFEEKLQANDIEYVKIDKDNLVAVKSDRHVVNASYNNAVPNITTAFYSWESLLLWVEYKLQQFSVLQKVHIATTFENREVFLLKISTGRKNTAVFVMGGEEGRDWLSPVILLNFVDYFLEHQPNVELLIKHYDFYILPLFNPDGYAYSTTEYPYWAQNRQRYFPKKRCGSVSMFGINVDRNWFFRKDLVRNDECDPVYSGSKSISEKETEGVAKFLDSIALQMLAFINVRSYEYLVTIPYGNDHEYCNNYPVLLDIITSVHDKIRMDHNKTFFYGTTAQYLYNFTGNVADWVKRKLNTPIVYTFYMKADDHLFPSAKDIQPMTNQFTTMINKILLLSSSIYSPLFNHQIRHSIQAIVIIINILCTLII